MRNSLPTGAINLLVIFVGTGILWVGPLPCSVVAQEAEHVTNPVPEPRIGHGLVYHERLQRVLLFGGRDGNSVEHADLWAWDGETWTLLNDGTSVGPSPRSRFGMAYDRSRDRLVLHGGGTRQEEFGDTWEWDGERWIQVDETGPGPRSHHGMAYDATHKRMILFGGGRDDEGLFFDDTWSWDGQRWIQLKVNGPPGRVLYDVASDPADGAIYLFGGFGDNRARYNDLWHWDGMGWDSLTASGPAPRISSALTYVSDRQSLFLAGGETLDGETGDSWLYESGQWHRLNEDGPRRDQHDMAYDAARGRVVLFGGTVAGRYRSDVWEWDGSRWMVVRE